MWRIVFKHVLDINNELIEEYEDVETFQDAVDYAYKVIEHLDVREISFKEIKDEFTWNL